MTKFRYVLAVITVFACIAMILFTAKRYLTTPGLSIRQYRFISRNFAEQPITLPDRPYNDLTDGGIQAKLTLSNNLFQVTLLVSAALAGLMIARDKEAGFVLSKPPEIIMFVVAGLLLLLSFVSHALYVNEISYLYFLAGKFADKTSPSMPDVADDNVSFLLKKQLDYFMAGAVLVAVTFLSAHVLKGGKKK